MVKRFFVIISVLLMVISFTACEEIDSTRVSSSNNDKSISENVLLRLDKNEYETSSAKIEVSITNNSPEKEYAFGEEIFLEVIENGEYKSVGRDLIFDDMLYVLPPLGEEKIKISLNEKFDNLAVGEYRLGLNITEVGYNLTEKIFVEFILK